ncbi:hypothetical protein FACS189455_0220 [Bacteroidia bacterium]|nr:hypothetical protein FACS189455_0220 [Bacteroidia bacterium]
MLRNRIIVPILLLVILVVSCTSGKNTAGTRWYHSFNTRYNVYFNGDEAFKEALKTQLEGYQENYSEMIYMYPISAASKDKEQAGGSFDLAIEKAVKAIKTHSITTKPKKETGKRNDPGYQEFMNREEYNPFLYNAWLLMAKSQFYNGDFLLAASSFSYISRHYASQPDIATLAKLWQAKSYVEMEWFYEAEDILNKVNNGKVSKENSELYTSVNAELLIKQKKYADAVSYLQMAIKYESNRQQRSRMKYLLGQIYQILDRKDLAYKAYGDVIGSNPSYKLEFSAKIRQTEVYPGGDNQKVIKILKKMSNSSKNKDYLDQVYYALGNVYLSIPDTVKAIENYELGVEKSIANGLEKAFCQIKLGDIYFEQRKYVKAQPNYSGALSQLKKEDKDYDRVSRRSEALDELIVHYEAVHLQDSLQNLAKLSEGERLAIVNKIIEELKKKEAEEKKQAEREEFFAEQEARQIEQQASNPSAGAQPGVVTAPQAPGQDGIFYFYSQQAVSSGKSAFQQKWGKRVLEDDWRRRNKTNPMTDQFAEKTEQPQDSLALTSDSLALAENDSVPPLVTDPYNPVYYLQHIPLTEKDLEASNLIIIEGLYNMGLIYKDKLEDYELSIESFDELNTRFPENEHKLMAYYNLYLIYLRMGNTQMAELFKSKIRVEFPESDYAIAMGDPDYEYNIKMIDVIQDSIYQQTYAGYLKGNVKTIRNNYELAAKKYPQSKLMPKFMFLDALSYVMTQQQDTFKVRLKTLIEKYPDADVSVLAGEMLAGLQRGLALAGGDGNLAKGSLFNISFVNPGDSVSIDSTVVFTAEKNTPYMLMLMYPKGTVNENLLLFTVAEYNFGNFKVTDFDLKLETFGAVGMLQIKGFENFDEVIQYWKMIYREGGYGRKVDSSAVIIPISLSNFDLLTKGKTVEEYTNFFETHFGKENAVLIEKWKDKEDSFVAPEPEVENSKDGELESEVDEPEKEAEIESPAQLGVKKDFLLVVRKQDSTAVSKDTISGITKNSQGGVQGSAREMVKDAFGDENYDKVNRVAGKVSETLDDVQNTIDKISSDPVRGVQDLFKGKKKTNAIDDYVKEQEKAERELQKQQKKEQEEQAKAAKKLAEQQAKEERELKKKQEEEDKALLKQKQQEEKEKERLKKEAEKQAKAEKERLAKEKEETRKKKQDEYKAEQKRKEEERKIKEKQYKEEQKLKEKARQEAQKKREEERKAEQKRKEEERKAKQKAYKEQQELKKK